MAKAAKSNDHTIQDTDKRSTAKGQQVSCAINCDEHYYKALKLMQNKLPTNIDTLKEPVHPIQSLQ